MGRGEFPRDGKGDLPTRTSAVAGLAGGVRSTRPLKRYVLDPDSSGRGGPT